jgi:hypothetical protein
MKLLITAAVSAILLFAEQSTEVEQLSAAERQELADAEAHVRAAESRLLELKNRIRFAHGQQHVALGRCEWTEVQIWENAWALKTKGRTCGLSDKQETARTK